jgi:hypothetical protein
MKATRQFVCVEFNRFKVFKNLLPRRLEWVETFALLRHPTAPLT